MSTTNFYETISTLRAVRKLKPDPIPNETLVKVLQAATFAPSGGNRQPWRIIAVADSDKKKTLADLYKPLWYEYRKGYEKGGDKHNPETISKEERSLIAGDYLADHFADSPVICVFCFHPGLMAITDSGQPRPSVVGGGSVYPAVQNLLLAARKEGLGCVLTTLLCIAEPAVKELLSIPDKWWTAAFIPLGYPVSKGHGPVNRRPIESMVYSDSFGQPFAT